MIGLIALCFSTIEALAYPIHWNAPKHQLTPTLIKVVENVSEKSPVVVNSTLRSKKHNRRVGGAHRSYHLTGNAVDFRIRPVAVKHVTAYLLTDPRVGGIKHYGGGRFHIDLGPRRTWKARSAPSVKFRRTSRISLRIKGSANPVTNSIKNIILNKHDVTP